MLDSSARLFGFHLPFALALALLAGAPLGAVPLCQTTSENAKFWGGTLMQMVSLQTGLAIDTNAKAQPKSAQGSADSATDSAFGALDSRLTTFAPAIGAHIGVTYMNPEDWHELDYGWRIKYLFSYAPKVQRDSHYIGAFFYLHPFPNPYHKFAGAIQTHTDCYGAPDGYPTPFSLVLGSGVAISKNPLGSVVGGYIELGIAFFKWFPVNAEVLYRLSLYPSNHYYIETATHSINIVFNIL